MRGEREVIALAGARLRLQGWLISWLYSLVMGFGVSMGLFACGVAAQRKSTRAELHKILSSDAEIALHSVDDYEIEQLRQQERKEAQKELETGKHSSPKNFLTYFNIPMTVVIVILIEVYINFKATLPVSENAYAVGQWMPLVTVALAFAAATINEAYRPDWEKRQKIYEADKKARLAEGAAQSRATTTSGQGGADMCSGALPRGVEAGEV